MCIEFCIGIKMEKRSFGDALRSLLNYQTDENENTELTIHTTAKQGDFEKILGFCESKLDINQVDDRGQTPLYIATFYSHFKIVEALLKFGATQVPVECDMTRNYPLHTVRDAQIAAILIQYGGNVNETNSVNETPLHRAIYQSNLDLINVLLVNNANITVRTEEGLTPLHCALSAYEPSTDIVSRLLKAGANVNDIDYRNRTPLHHYCSGYQLSTSIVRLILSYGCKVDIRDFSGSCPIHIYITVHKATSRAFLKLLGPNRDAINLTDNRGRTPLILAIINMNIEDSLSLIQLGAHVNAKDHHGKTALHYVSASHESVAIIDLLIQHDADINCEDLWGRNPLFHCVDSKNAKGCTILLKHGASVNHQDKCGLSPLHIACLKGMRQTVTELIEYGANVNLLDVSGETPLHKAATTRHVNIISCLVEQSADTSITNNKGLLPSQIADIYGNEEIVTTLKGRSSNLNKLSSIGRKCIPFQEAKTLLEKKTVKRSEESLQNYFTTILETPMAGPGLVDEEAKEIQVIIEHQIQTLAKKIGELDERFCNIVLHAGSSSEGTKTNFPDEFDFMFSLENFSSHCEFEFVVDDKVNEPWVTINDLTDAEKDNGSDETETESFEGDSDPNVDILEISVSDYVKVSLKDDKQSEKFRQIMCSSVLGCATMNTVFSQLIERVVFSAGFPRDPRLIPIEVTVHPSLRYSWYGSTYKEMKIDVDIVPALRLPTWPPKVMRDSVLFDQELQNIACMVVPKMTSGLHWAYWRCSLALIETAIFRKLKSKPRNAYIICKSIKSSSFLPSVEFEDKESRYAKHAFQQLHPEFESEQIAVYKDVESVVPSYILKMVFLGLIEEKIRKSGISKIYSFSGDAADTATRFNRDKYQYGPAVHMNVSESSTEIDVSLVREVFLKSLEYLEQRFVPSVFNRKHNILSEKFLFEGGIETAIFFLKLILELLHD